MATVYCSLFSEDSFNCDRFMGHERTAIDTWDFTEEDLTHNPLPMGREPLPGIMTLIRMEC